MGTKRNQVCRFAVRSEDGRRSSLWRIWTSTSGKKSDIYLTPRPLAGSLKVSIHESGQCQVSFTTEFLRRIADLGTWNRGSRHLVKWPCSRDPASGVTLAVKVVVPTSELIEDPIVQTQRKPMIWVTAAPPGKAIEFAIVLTGPDTKVSHWPGKRSMATQLVARMLLASGHVLWVVHRTVDPPQGALDEMAKLKAHPEKVVRLDSRHDIDFSNRQLRAVIVGEESDGSGYLIEAAFPASEKQGP